MDYSRCYPIPIFPEKSCAAMARKVVVELVDDLDGTPIEQGAGGTVSFAFDGVTYEIDLSDASRVKLAEALEPFIAAGRRAGNSPVTARRRSAARESSGRDLNAVRQWARTNGHQVSDRGRVPAAVLEAYDAANAK